MTLRVGQMARLNFTLQVGNVGEVVDVEAQGLLLETQSGVTGNVVTAETLVNLPLSGRNFTTLGNLTAGVVASGTQFRASGARGMYQQVSFDGVSALNNRGNNLFMYPSVDAVEEFKVQATNYTAEYGGHAGANVQLQLKSGHQQLPRRRSSTTCATTRWTRATSSRRRRAPSRSSIATSSAA